VTTFLELQADVMGDRFVEGQRDDVKRWINSTYWRVWTLEEWTFRYATANVTVTSGSQTVTNLPADLGLIRVFQRGDGTPLTWMEPEDFARVYHDPRASWTGLPEAYTVLNGVVSVGPASSETASDYQIEYEREWVKLVNDGDVPLLPDGCLSDILVAGPVALGQKEQNDFTWQFLFQTFQDGLDALRRGYLVSARDAYQSLPADPLGSAWWG
jgi:hypothetical protein